MFSPTRDDYRDEASLELTVYWANHPILQASISSSSGI